MSRSYSFRFIAVLASVVVFALSSLPQAHAETLIKRVNCKDANAFSVGDLYLYHQNNVSGATLNITAQIVRDGCRPKLTDAEFTLWSNPNIGFGDFVAFRRNGKRTNSITVAIPFNYRAFIFFRSLTGANIGGTFDYVYTIH